MRNGNLLKSGVTEIRVKQIRVNQGLGVDETNLSLQGEQTPEFQRVSDSQGQAVKVQLDLRSKTCAFFSSHRHGFWVFKLFLNSLRFSFMREIVHKNKLSNFSKIQFF